MVLTVFWCALVQNHCLSLQCRILAGSFALSVLPESRSWFLVETPILVDLVLAFVAHMWTCHHAAVSEHLGGAAADLGGILLLVIVGVVHCWVVECNILYCSVTWLVMVSCYRQAWPGMTRAQDTGLVLQPRTSLESSLRFVPSFL